MKSPNSSARVADILAFQNEHCPLNQGSTRQGCILVTYCFIAWATTNQKVESTNNLCNGCSASIPPKIQNPKVFIKALLIFYQTPPGIRVVRCTENRSSPSWQQFTRLDSAPQQLTTKLKNEADMLSPCMCTGVMAAGRLKAAMELFTSSHKMYLLLLFRNIHF